MVRIWIAGAVATLMFGASVLMVASVTTAQSTPTSVKGDRLDIKTSVQSCSQQSWPYYEAHCLRSTVKPTRDVAEVRIVSTDISGR
jgi:hypothetical protein